MQATYKETAIKAAKEAGKIQLYHFGKGISKKTKKDDSFVTKADILCTRKIREIIRKEFPEHSILCEELGELNNNSDYKWVIDPIDGTHNFIMDNPLFGASIALLHKKEVILGVVYMPVLKKMYYAEKGKGSYCNGKKIRVNKDSLKKGLCTFDAKLRGRTKKKIDILRKLAKEVWRFRVFGVSVYNNILVAQGNAGLNIDHDSNPWDHCASLLIVEEAGGKVTDFQGKRWTPYVKDYISSNGKVHARVLNVLKK